METLLRSEYKTLEFKYLIAQEKIEQLRTELKSKEAIQNVSSQKTLLLPKEFADAAFETVSLIGRDEFCQTDSPERKNFQNQVNIQIEHQSISTQTDRKENNVIEVQENFQLDTELTVASTFYAVTVASTIAPAGSRYFLRVLVHFLCALFVFLSIFEKNEAVVGPEKFNLRQSLAANNVTPTPP